MTKKISNESPDILDDETLAEMDAEAQAEEARKLPITVTLNVPIRQGSETITELVFSRRVVSGDMRGIPMRKEMHWDEAMLIAARVAGVPPSITSKLDFDDMAEVAGVVGRFLMSGQKIGPVPAE